MANKKIEVDVIIDSADSQQKLRELTKALKQLPAGTDDWKKVYGEIKKISSTCRIYSEKIQKSLGDNERKKKYYKKCYFDPINFF